MRSDLLRGILTSTAGIILLNSCNAGVHKANPAAANELIKQGVEATLKNDNQTAFSAFDRAIQADPQSYSAYNNRGLINKRMKRYPEAIQDFTAAINVNPTYAPAFINRGNAYSETTEYAKAKQDYRHAIDLAPTDSAGYINLAEEELRANRLDTAIAILSLALVKIPNSADIYKMRASIYKMCKQIALASKDEEKAKALSTK